MAVKIFVSYAYRDKLLVDDLRRELLPLEQQGLIEIWQDIEIAPGGEWNQAIDKYLSSADIILPMLSPDFLDSDYCYSKEMQEAIERHERGEAQVIPILLRPVHWQATPFSKLQTLPRNAQPVTSWVDRDEAFASIAREIMHVITRDTKGNIREKISSTKIGIMSTRNRLSPRRIPFARRQAILVAGVIVILFTLLAPILFFTSQKRVTVPIPSISSAPPVCVSASIVIDGSTILQPLVQEVAANYMSRCPSATITISGSGSQQGLDNVENGTIDIGTSDVLAPRDLSYSDLNDHVVAAVVYVLIIHQGLGITNLTTDQIRGIYNGTYTNWRQLGGANLPITAISREANSGTRVTFDQYVVGGSEKSTPQPATNTQEVVQGVQTIPGAIGYVPLNSALARSTDLSIISIDGFSYKSYRDNHYSYWNLEHMYTKKPVSSSPSPRQLLAQAFINYMGNTNTVKQIINNASFISVVDIPSSTLATRY